MIARGKPNNPKFSFRKPQTVKKAAQLPSVRHRRSTQKHRPNKPCPKGNDVCYCR